jgi:hypothetical protein
MFNFSGTINRKKFFLHMLKSCLHNFRQRSYTQCKIWSYLMVRISKQEERRQRCPKKHKAPAKKTGPKKDNLTVGYKPHANSLEGITAESFFIPKIK